LPQIGVNFQYGNIGTGTNSTIGGTLTLDTNTLQNAFNSDSAGTVSMLSQAIQGFYNLAQQYDAPGYGSINSDSQSLQQSTWLEQFLSQNQNSFNPANNLPTLSELLEAQPATSGGAGFTSQQIQAIQQYAQVQMLAQPDSLNQSIIAALYGGGSSSGGISTFA
jgi:hypothetical protein